MKLPEISSEFIEPHITKTFGEILEAVGHGSLSPADAKQMLRGIEWFVSQNCGIHARIAMSNEYFKVYRLSDVEFQNLCKDIVREMYADV